MLGQTRKQSRLTSVHQNFSVTSIRCKSSMVKTCSTGNVSPCGLKQAKQSKAGLFYQTQTAGCQYRQKTFVSVPTIGSG